MSIAGAQDHDKDGTSEVKRRPQDMRQECSKGKIVRGHETEGAW